MNAALYEKLVEVAKAGKLITYKELGFIADLDASHLPDIDKMVDLLTEVANFEIDAGRPLLVIVAIREDLGMPAKGLFKYAKSKGIQPKKTDDVSYFAQEIRRVYDYWKTH